MLPQSAQPWCTLSFVPQHVPKAGVRHWRWGCPGSPVEAWKFVGWGDPAASTSNKQQTAPSLVTGFLSPLPNPQLKGPGHRFRCGGRISPHYPTLLTPAGWPTDSAQSAVCTWSQCQTPPVQGPAPQDSHHFRGQWHVQVVTGGWRERSGRLREPSNSNGGSPRPPWR